MEGPIAFDIHTPLNDEIIKRQIASSMSLRLPEMDGADLRSLTIVANGPSARGLTFEGPCLALNGALNLFPKDKPPKLWAACDPQAIVADFLIDPSPETTFIVASKCHPSVFERLKGFDVRLWHINDQDIPGVRKVPCAVSVTLCAMMLMHRLGYRELNIYGWDCCYGEDGSHHAGASVAPHPDDVTVEFGERLFKTNHVWGAEAQDAINIIPVLEWCGTEVKIHGDSMIAAIREFKQAA